MKRTVLMGMALVFVFAMFLSSCSGGNGSNVNAQTPTIFDAGVSKKVLVYSAGINIFENDNFVGSITVEGNMITLLEFGKTKVFIDCAMQVLQN